MEEFLQNVGLVIFASLFVLSGVNHLRNHTQLAGYAASGFGNCPFAIQLGFLGGAPTGLFLVAGGVGAAFGEPVALFALAGFLTVVTALYHRNFLTDPGSFKTLALAGASLALATLV